MLVGCSAVHKGIKYSDLDVQTKMSETIFLDPTLSSQKLVYLEIRNTSDKPNFQIEPQIKTALESKGYKVTSIAQDATTVIQINLLSVGRAREDDPFAALGSGFAGAFQGAAMGALAGGLVSDSYGGFGAGALIGGAVGVVSDAMVEVMTYNLITDVQITQQSNLAHAPKKDPKVYQTRIISMARRVNLDFESAVPSLQQGLVSSLSGLLP